MKVDSEGNVIHDGEWEHDQPKIISNNNNKSQSIPQQPVFIVVENQLVQDGPGRVGTYRGIYNQTTGLPSGSGTLVYSPVTSSKDNHGLDQYEGCFDEQGYFHGAGRLIYKNGDSYDGNFHQGQKQGNGTFKWSDGRIYKGQYHNDLKHGKGKFIYGGKSSAMYDGKQINVFVVSTEKKCCYCTVTDFLPPCLFLVRVHLRGLCQWSSLRQRSIRVR